MCRFKSGVAVVFNERAKVYTLPGSDSHNEIRAFYNIRDDNSPAAARQVSVELIPVASLTELSGMKFELDSERPDWWTDEMSVEAEKQLFQAIQAEFDGRTLKSKGSIDLGRLEFIPEGVTLKAGGNLLLGGLESIPEGVTLKAGSDLILYSLESIPEGVTLEAGDSLYLGRLKSISEGVTLEAGGDLRLYSLESIPEGVSVKASKIYLTVY